MAPVGKKWYKHPPSCHKGCIWFEGESKKNNTYSKNFVFFKNTAVSWIHSDGELKYLFVSMYDYITMVTQSKLGFSAKPPDYRAAPRLRLWGPSIQSQNFNITIFLI